MLLAVLVIVQMIWVQLHCAWLHLVIVEVILMQLCCDWMQMMRPELELDLTFSTPDAIGMNGWPFGWHLSFRHAVRHPFPDTFRIGRQCVTRFLEADAER